MTNKFFVLATSALVATACAHGQTALPGAATEPAAPPAQPPPAQPPPWTPEQLREAQQQAQQAQRRAQVEREAMEARQEEALSKPAAWGEMNRDELEKSIGGRTLVEVKATQATLEQVADMMRAQAKLDVFTAAQLTAQLTARLPGATAIPSVPAPQAAGGYKPPTYDFDVSRRPLWEAVRAMSLAVAARQLENQAAFSGYGYGYGGYGNSLFNDIGGPRNEMLRMPTPPASASLRLAPVLITRPAPSTTVPPSPGGKEPSAEEKQRMAQAQAPRITAASPRNPDALWQLSSSESYSGSYGESDNFAQGRAYASWPCLFLIDYIARKQEDYLAPDASEALPKALAKAPDAPTGAAGAPQVLAPAVARAGAQTPPKAAGQTSQSQRVALNEWSQRVALQMRAYVEPRLRQYRNVRLVVDEARDEAGRDLRHADFAKPRRIMQGQGNQLGYGQPNAALNLPIMLDLPRERGDKLHLRGALLFWVPARMATVEVPLDDSSVAARQAIFWGQAVGMKVKLSRSGGKTWLLGTDIEMKGTSGQLDFRREMGVALTDDESYRAGLILPGSVRAQSEDGSTWRLKPFSEEQKLTLNAGEDMISRKTNYIGAFRNARSPDGYFTGYTSGGGGSGIASGSFAASLQRPNSSLESAIALASVPPDGYAYTENVTWQLEPTGDGAGGTGDEPPAITKIFFDAPQEWREVRVPFEFRDLPLPPR